MPIAFRVANQSRPAGKNADLCLPGGSIFRDIHYLSFTGRGPGPLAQFDTHKDNATMALSHVVKKPTSASKSNRKSKIRSIKLVNLETGEYATILPNLGATIRELVLRHGKRLFSVLESPLSYQELIKNRRYAGVKLIPFPGRIAGGTYHHEGRKYKLQSNTSTGFALHGFVYDKPFRLTKAIVRDSLASVVLDYVHRGDTKGYPFKFSVRLRCTLTAGSFCCTTEIRNIDKRQIPMGDGWHPYFRTSGPIKQLLLSLPAHSVVELTPSKIPTGKIIKPNPTSSIISLRKKKLDTVFDLGEKKRRVTTKLIDPKLALQLQLWQDAGNGKYRYLVVYRPSSESSVAIEPWTCAPNAFNNKMGLIVLKPGGKFKASYGVSLRKLAR